LSDRNEQRRRQTADHLLNQTVTPQGGSLLNFSVPTEIVELPSGGKLYPAGHPLHGKKEVEIRHMTAKEEDILASQALLKRGIAIDRMLQNVIVEKNVSVADLLIGDRNALMFAARITGYGSAYPVKMDCQACFKEFDHTFDLGNFTDCYTNTNNEDVKYTANGTIEVELPKTGALVEIKALTGNDDERLTKSREMKEKHGLPDSSLTDMLKAMIYSVNGVMDGNDISGFVDNMPALDARKIRETYKESMPNVQFVQEAECSHCGYTVESEVPITGDFFWPG
jgi:hypothetical protein